MTALQLVYPQCLLSSNITWLKVKVTHCAWTEKLSWVVQNFYILPFFGVNRPPVPPKWRPCWTLCDVQCTEDVAVAEETSEVSNTLTLSPQSQQLSTPMLSTVTQSSQQHSALILAAPDATPQPLTAAEPDSVLSNTPPPVSKPTDHLVPLDLQPFIK